MFSGLIEEVSSVLKVESQKNLLRVWIKRPKSFSKIKEGDSICVDGVCLTLEKFDKQKMQFGLAPETLKITKWTAKNLKNKAVNLERSLSLQSALGGHLTTGHVDGLATVTSVKKKGESKIVKLRIPKGHSQSFWKKGYITLNGTSLTINEAKGSTIELCLIPKTLNLTNLNLVKKGDLLNFEVDYFTRILVKNFHNFLNELKNSPQ